MKTSLYTKEMKRSRKNLMIWTAIVVGFTLMVTALYPAMEVMGDDISGLMEDLPEALRRSMGVDENTWSSILGFYSTYFGIYIVVLTGIYTASAGATILSKEERDRTSEFLMTRPISRSEVFGTKMKVLFSLAAIILVVQLLTAILGLTLFGKEEFSWATFATMHVHGTGLVLLFTCLGVLVSMFLSPKTNFMGLVVGMVFGSYFLDALSKATPSTEWLGFVSPFHYADFQISRPGYELEWLNVSLMLVVGLGCLVIASRKFEMKDFDS